MLNIPSNVKQSYWNEIYDIQDKIATYYPAEIKRLQNRIVGLEKDIKQAEEQTKLNDDGFSPMKINDIVYPMYLPDNTYLTGQDTVKTKDGSRLILTFGGDKSFVLVEETASTADTLEVIPVSGNFDFLSDVIGVIGNKSLSWHSNGIDYYMTSDTLEVSELVSIARSVSVLPVSK